MDVDTPRLGFFVLLTPNFVRLTFATFSFFFSILPWLFLSQEIVALFSFGLYRPKFEEDHVSVSASEYWFPVFFLLRFPTLQWPLSSPPTFLLLVSYLQTPCTTPPLIASLNFFPSRPYIASPRGEPFFWFCHLFSHQVQSDPKFSLPKAFSPRSLLCRKPCPLVMYPLSALRPMTSELP